MKGIEEMLRVKKKQNYIRFRNGEESIDNEEMDKEINRGIVRISKSMDLKMIESILKEVESWRVTHLKTNSLPQFLYYLPYVGFPSLKVLSLERNQMMSIEPLSTMSMPALKTINLSCNKICWLQTIRKCGWPHLKQLYISQNPFNDTSRAVEKLQTGRMKEFSFESLNKSQWSGWWAMKLQPFKLKQISYRTYCPQNKPILEKIYQRFGCQYQKPYWF